MSIDIKALALFLCMLNVVSPTEATIQLLTPNAGLSSSVKLYASKQLYHLEPNYNRFKKNKSLAVSLLKNETDYIQLHIDNPHNEEILLSVSSPAGYSAEFLRISKVHEISQNGVRTGHTILDPVQPIGSEANLGEHSGIDLLLKLIPNDSNIGGEKKGSIALEFGVFSATYDFYVDVRDFSVEPSFIGTQIFHIDSKALAYELGYPMWHPKFITYAEKMRNLLAQHHISPSRIPYREVVDWMRLPSVVKSGGGERKHLLFSSGTEVSLSAPKFEHLGSSFLLDLEFYSASGDIGDFMSYVWGQRKSGFKISLENSELSIHFGTGEEFKKYSLSTIENLKMVQRLRLEIGNKKLKWTLGDDQSAVIDIPDPAFRQAFGGEFILRSDKDDLRLYNIDWPENKSDFVSFPTMMTELANLKSQRSLAEERVNQYRKIQKQLTWLESNSLWENDITYWLSFDNDFKHGKRPSKERSYITLPRDEAVKGAAMRENLRVAREQKSTGYKIFHTLGTMHNKGVKREDVLHEYGKHVDILAIRPLVYLLEQDFFESYKGDVSLYLHDTHWAYSADNLMNARLIFWFGDYHNIQMYSYWNVNLWYQAYKTSSRVQRYSRQAGKDYEFTKRNPSGPNSGVLLYPGKDGPLSSLQLIAWSKGIEDQWLLIQARNAGVDLSKLRFSGMERYSEWASNLKPKDFRKKLGSVNIGRVKTEIAERLMSAAR